MHILVTGAAGQLGCCLADRLIEQSIPHTLVTRNDLDISDLAAVRRFLSSSSATHVINAAAYTAVDRAEDEPDLAAQINVLGPQNLANVCAELDRVLLHVSTDYVFDGSADVAYRESNLVGPTGIYGQTKLDGERAVINSNEKHIILRTAWVFSEHGNNFLKTMLRLAETRDELSVVADQLGCPTYAGDIANALIAIAKALSGGSRDYGVYHFAAEQSVTWHGFAKQIFAEAEKMGKIEKAPIVHAITSEQFPTPAKRPAFSVLDSSKIQETFAVPPSDWIAGIRSTLSGL